MGLVGTKVNFWRMRMNPKDIIAYVSEGSDFYFRFKEIDIIKDGNLIAKLTNDNCGDAYSTFRKGGETGGIVTHLDFSEEGMCAIQKAGAFRSMEAGFDFFLLGRWRWVANNRYIDVIAYDINSSGIDKICIVGSEDAIIVQIFTDDGYTVQLCNPLDYFIPGV